MKKLKINYKKFIKDPNNTTIRDLLLLESLLNIQEAQIEIMSKSMDKSVLKSTKVILKSLKEDRSQTEKMYNKLRSIQRKEKAHKKSKQGGTNEKR